MIGGYDARAVLRRLGIEWREANEGRKLVAHCPTGSHPDAHPSWELACSGPRDGLHTCRACHFGGDLLTLVCLVRKFGNPRDRDAFLLAKAWLRGDAVAEKAEVPRTVRVVPGSPTRAGFEMPPEYIMLPLARWSSMPREYAASRRLDADAVALHRIGYAVVGRLAGRIIVPTLDASGWFASYAARDFVGEEPRYLTPSERWEHPDQSVLFGEHTWRDQRTVYVGEGAFNLLAVLRAVPGAAVAGLSGSNVSVGAVMKIAAFDDVVLVTDPDAAGDGATRKLAASFLRHRAFRRARLPPKVDADDFERVHGTVELTKVLLAAS